VTFQHATCKAFFPISPVWSNWKRSFNAKLTIWVPSRGKFLLVKSGVICNFWIGFLQFLVLNMQNFDFELNFHWLNLVLFVIFWTEISGISIKYAKFCLIVEISID
jgi:hypothetical protein